MCDPRATFLDTAIWNNQNCHLLRSHRRYMADSELLIRDICNLLLFILSFHQSDSMTEPSAFRL